MRFLQFPVLIASMLFAGIASAAPPNIVFILTDDLRFDALSIAGHPFVKTPNIDRIGREGARFRNMFVTTPLCSPSRASFLTGQFVHKHGVLDNTDHNELSHKLVTYPALLRRAGFETAFMGKWHMGTDDMPRPGFDRWVSFKGQGAYNDPDLNFDGKRVKTPGYITDILNDEAVKFLKQPHKKPFILYLAEKAVHGPFTPADRYKDLFTNDTIQRAPNTKDTLEGKPVLQRKIGDLPPIGPGTGPNDQVVRNQLRTLMAVEESVGKILKTLEDLKQLDNTVVVFTSDNGYFWGEHGLGDKRAAYEESIRTPLVIRYPKLIRAGTVLDQMVLNVDIAPTMMEIAGQTVPDTFQGRSLVPLFRNKDAPWRTSLLAEYYEEKGNPRIPTYKAIRTPRSKYIHYLNLDGMDEFYDLTLDPYEMNNVVDKPGEQKELARMKAELERLLQQTK